MANVIATLPGERPERIVLASHFDTKLFEKFRFVGASDGASSTAALLELGRVLKDKPRPFTIELLFLDGEEAFETWGGTDHTYGSRYYVQQAHKTNTLSSLKALILLDMIGDKDLNIRREENSTRWLTDIIWTTARRLGHRGHFLTKKCQSKTTTSSFSTPASRRWTSSISTISPGTRRRHTGERQRRRACRLWATWSSRRCRRSRRGC